MMATAGPSTSNMLDGVELTSSNVEQAVLQFYQSSATQETHKWLTLAQLSPQAWSFCWDLITPDKKHEVQFFGASCLAVKVSRCWGELRPEQFPGLRKRLLDTMTSYQGPKIVLTRICVAVSGLVIHCVPEHWPEPITDIISMFQPQLSGPNPNFRSLTLLLELLTVIPEEFSTLLLSSNRRSTVRNAFSSSLGTVLPFLLGVMSHHGQEGASTEATLQACKCVQAWVQFGVPLDSCDPVVDRLLHCVGDEELQDTVIEALSSLVSHPDTHKYPQRLMGVLKKILPLDTMLHQYMAEGSYEMCLPVLSLFITFGESHSRLLIDWSTSSSEGRDVVLRLVTAILAASSCHAQFPTQETISEMPFGFWYILQDDIIACEPEQYQQCVALFGPVYTALVNAMLHKSMYDPKDGEWSADQRESLRCYRTDIADTIMYSFNILRDGLLHSLLQHLDSAISGCLNNPAQWPPLEACLHAWYAVAESLADSEEEEANPLLSMFLAKLPVIPFHNNTRVISTALDCIGGFSDWLAMHPQLLPHVTPIVTSALASSELSMAATMALKDISRDCTDSMKPYAEQVISSIQQSLTSGTLNTGECVRLMYPLGKMLSLLPPQQILPRLEPLLANHMQALDHLSKTPPDQNSKNRIIFVLKLLTMLFTTLDIARREDDQPESECGPLVDPGSGESIQQPVFLILKQCLPVYSAICANYSTDPDITEAVCTNLKQGVSTLQDEIKPLTQEVLTLAMACYRATPQPAALDLSKQFFIMYGREAEMVDPLRSLLAEVSSISLATIQTATLSDHADLIDCFYSMLGQVLKKQPGLFLSPNLDTSLLMQAAISCLTMPEQHPVKSVAGFINHLISVSREVDPLVPIVNNHGEQLFMQVIKCVGGDASRSYIDYFTDILLALNKKYFDNLCRYMNSMVATENFPTELCSREAKEHFARSVLKERANKRKLQETVREFSLLSRGLLGSEYAAQLVQLGL